MPEGRARALNLHALPLNVGDCLGHYDVTAQIGAGGMGEVYRARDTKLVSVLCPSTNTRP